MITWTAGPPPFEWRDGRDVLVWGINGAKVAMWSYDEMWIVEDWYLHTSQITHHAAVNGPEQVTLTGG